MSAKYLEIPINSSAASGTMDLVINSRASSTLASGTNAAQGNVATISGPGGTNTGYTPGTTVGVATTGGTGTACTVDVVVNGGGDVATITLNATGTAYTAADTLTVNGAGGTNCTFTVSTIDNASIPARLTDATATFITDGIAAADLVYDGTTAVGAVLTVDLETQITCTTGLFPVGGETYNIRKPKQLNSTGATFTTRKVRVGDIVDNTTAATNTTVAALIDETSLTLTTDIFAALAEYDDNFTITPAATEVYDATQSFLTTVTKDDVVENTTDSTTGTIVAIIDDYRIDTTQAAMFGDGDTFTIFDQTITSNKIYNIDSIISTDRGGDNFTTLVNLSSINASANLVTITHSDQGTGRIVSSAIETALVRGAVGINLPEPPGPAVTRVIMPISDGSQVVVDTVLVS
tara:strand:- start:4386 stop:5606 length:1221 start_codon:yes stop_codon:yes gene_type:complete